MENITPISELSGMFNGSMQQITIGQDAELNYYKQSSTDRNQTWVPIPKEDLDFLRMYMNESLLQEKKNAMSDQHADILSIQTIKKQDEFQNSSFTEYGIDKQGQVYERTSHDLAELITMEFKLSSEVKKENLLYTFGTVEYEQNIEFYRLDCNGSVFISHESLEDGTFRGLKNSSDRPNKLFLDLGAICMQNQYEQAHKNLLGYGFFNSKDNELFYLISPTEGLIGKNLSKNEVDTLLNEKTGMVICKPMTEFTPIFMDKYLYEIKYMSSVDLYPNGNIEILVNLDKLQDGNKFVSQLDQELRSYPGLETSIENGNKLLIFNSIIEKDRPLQHHIMDTLDKFFINYSNTQLPSLRRILNREKELEASTAGRELGDMLVEVIRETRNIFYNEPETPNHFVSYVLVNRGESQATSSLIIFPSPDKVVEYLNIHNEFNQDLCNSEVWKVNKAYLPNEPIQNDPQSDLIYQRVRDHGEYISGPENLVQNLKDYINDNYDDIKKNNPLNNDFMNNNRENDGITIKRVGHAQEYQFPESDQTYYRISLLKNSIGEKTGLDGLSVVESKNNGQFVNLSIRSMKMPKEYATHSIIESLYHTYKSEDKYALINLNLDYKKLMALPANEGGYINITAAPKMKSAEQGQDNSHSNAEWKVYVTKPKGEEIKKEDYLGHGSTINHSQTQSRDHSSQRTNINYVGNGFVDSVQGVNKEQVINVSLNQEKLTKYLNESGSEKIYINFRPKENAPNQYAAYISENKNDPNAAYTFKLKGDKTNSINELLKTARTNDEGYFRLVGYYRDNTRAVQNQFESNFNISVVEGLTKDERAKLGSEYKPRTFGEGADKEAMLKWRKGNDNKQTSAPDKAKSTSKSSSQAKEASKEKAQETKKGGVKPPSLKDNAAKKNKGMEV